VSDIFTMADLDGLLQLMRDTRHEYPGPFFPAVIALIDDVGTYHRPDENGDCEAPGCQDPQGDISFNQNWPCPLWMRAHTVVVAWLRERAAEALPADDPQRVAARERKRRQREREASSPVKANGNPSAKGSGNPSGNPVTNPVTERTPAGIHADSGRNLNGNEAGKSASSQVDGLRHGGTDAGVTGGLPEGQVVPDATPRNSGRNAPEGSDLFTPDGVRP
jgi:hypothetical protein